MVKPASRAATCSSVRSGVARMIVAASEGVFVVEKMLVAMLMALLLGLILLNVGTRYAGSSLYWVDEAAVWLTFIGGSALTRLRLDFAMTLVSDRLSTANATRLKAFAHVITLLFSLGLAVMCWNWMDPPGIAAAGFDARSYAGDSFNFLYTEYTQTLEWPVWMISLVIPIFSVTMILHTLANIVEEIGLSPKRVHPGFGSAEGVN